MPGQSLALDRVLLLPIPSLEATARFFASVLRAVHQNSFFRILFVRDRSRKCFFPEMYSYGIIHEKHLRRILLAHDRSHCD